jgi:hypothetical protein
MEIKDIRSVKHCILCKKHEYREGTGTVCSLSGQKEEIETDCANFAFRDDIEDFTQHLKDELLEAERIQLRLQKIMVRWFLAGLISIILGATIWTMPWNHGAIHIIPVSLIVVGTIILPQGAWEFFPHRMRLKQKYEDTHEYLLLIKHYKEISKS